MTRDPKISVVVPVKNGEKYLFDALQSVLTQSFSDFELLVVDDGSTDSSPDILAAFQQRDARVKVLSNPGSGLVDALNFGVASACAPLIARMDADDICLPERFQRQYDFLTAHPDVAVVGTQVIFVDEHGLRKAKSPSLPLTPDSVARLLLKGCCIRHPTVLFRREAFEQAGGYRHELVDAEDYDLWLRIADHASLANLSDALLYYRVHSGQVSKRKEWSQRLSRNLALQAALERQRGDKDPIASYACFSKCATRQRCQGLDCPNRLCESVRAFGIVEALVSDKQGPLSREEGWQILDYVSRNTIGDGKKPSHGVLMALCRQAVQRRAPLQLIAALSLAIRSHPGRTLRWWTTRPN